MKHKDLFKKDLLITIGLEYASLVLFAIFSAILYFLLVQITPAQMPDFVNLQNLPLSQIQQSHDELKGFMIGYFVILISLFLGAWLLYNLSRKLIWEKLVNKKFSLEGFWKYSVFNSAIVLIFSTLAVVTYFIIDFIVRNLDYFLAYFPDLLKNLVFQAIPLIVLYYLMIILIHASNHYYFKSKKKSFKEVYTKIKEIKLKKYILPIIAIFVSIYILNFLLYLKPDTGVFYVLGTVVYASQLAILKVLVKNYEK